MKIQFALSQSNKARFKSIFRVLTLSTIFVQIGFFSNTFAEKVNGPMLPDPMDIVQEAHTLPARVIPSHVLAATTVSENPVCQGVYPNNQWYRRCDMVGSGASIDDMVSNIRCEHFYFSRYAFQSLDTFVSRRNVSVLALSMARNNNKPITVTQQPDYKNIQNDLQSPMFPWTKPMVESDMSRNIVTSERTIFEPSRFVTRSEALSMLMASVCMYPKAGNDPDWQKNIYDVAYQNGLTKQSWKNFAPNKNISVRELAILTSRTADWAEKTGGCTLKPVQCVK